jgi:SAM-dependent methyltransferase
MQARWNNQATDYFSDDPFERKDEKPDSLFYENERLVHHIDETARGVVESTYNRFLTDGMAVLDLMGSWESHFPDHIILDRVIGLGLNEGELRSNPRLSDYMVHDLNLNPVLPFEDNVFDVVVNTVSVEYLVNPFAVFNEVLRILRPDGFFAVTFSNRWFPTKAIRIWSELHEFERMGLVLAYFLNAGGFTDLQTYSMRGLPRPFDDPYFPKLRHADPVYAVWGRKA